MRNISVEELKHIEYRILKYIDSVCQRNSITYYLDAGTLLGAVRHKGFIPWDDDIDIIVPRDQYKQLLDIIDKDNTQYKSISAYNNPLYKYLFAKVVDSSTYLKEDNVPDNPQMGVYVDIFPIDNLPNAKITREIVKRYAWILRQIMGHALIWERKGAIRGFTYSFLCLICYKYGWRRAFNKFEKLANKLSIKRAKWYSNLADAPNKHFEWDSSCFNGVKMVCFEGEMFPAPFGYDKVLRTYYDDYMKLPPLEKRVSHHSFDAYYRE